MAQVQLSCALHTDGWRLPPQGYQAPARSCDQGQAAMFATGATVGVLTGGPLLRRGLRQLVIGAAPAVVTYALGRVFGATLG